MNWGFEAVFNKIANSHKIVDNVDLRLKLHILPTGTTWHGVTQICVAKCRIYCG